MKNSFLQKIYNKIRSQFGTKHFRVYAAHNCNPSSPLNTKEFVFERLNEQDLENTKMCHENGRLDKFLIRLSEGHLCYGHKLKKTGEICSYFWVSDGEYVNHAPFAYDFKLNIPKETIYVADCRVYEAFRGKKLYTSGLIEIIKLYQDKEFLITAEISNVFSHKGIISAGYKALGIIDFMKFRDSTFFKNRHASNTNVTIFK